jgi:hypothetical protein
MDVEKIRLRGFAIAGLFSAQHAEHAGRMWMVLGCPTCCVFLYDLMQEAHLLRDGARDGAVVIDEGD